MSLVIPDEFLQTAHISAADLKLEIAILLFQQEKISLDTAIQFAGISQLEFQYILRSRKTPTHYSAEDLQPDLKILDVINADQVAVQPSQTDILQRIEQRRTFAPTQNHLPDTLTLLQDDRAR